LLAALLAASPTQAQGAGEPPAGEDVTDVLNALLSGLLGFTEMSGPELQKEVAEVGGIPFRREVPVDFMSRPDLARYLKEMLDAEYPPAKARGDERLLNAFGLLPPGTDLRALRAKVLEENIAGFYDERPGRRRLYAVSADRHLSPANQLILAHELRHALQDQYVTLEKVLPDDVSDFDDRRLAFISLLEGDATLVMERFLARRLPGGQDAQGLLNGPLATPDVPGAPPVVRDQLVLPYLVGLQFARALVDRGGWPAVQSAWQRPPESMEQVLHPEKYAAREAPRKIEVTAWPPGGRLVAEGVWGELLTRTLLGEGQEAAAQGWGGDRYLCFDVSGRTLLEWRSDWDSSANQAEFRKAFEARLLAEAGAQAQESRGFRIFAKGGFTRALGEARGHVVFLAADDRAVLDEALTRITGRPAQP
jgi:hypothetical protein